MTGTAVPSTTSADGAVALGGSELRSRWRLLAGASVVMALSGPGQTAGISVFIDPVGADLGISRGTISFLYLVATLCGAVGVPFVGRAIDRHGVRRMLRWIALGLGAVLFLLAGAQGVAMLGFGFVGARMLGQGAMSLCATTAVSVGFDAQRGTALGLLRAVGGSSISLVPLIADRLIVGFGWRWAWIALAVVVVVVVLPLGAWNVFPPGGGAGAPRQRAVSREPGFWLLAAGLGTTSALVTAVMFHQTALLGEVGLSSGEAAANFLPQSLAAAVGALAAGWLSDRVPARAMVPTAMAVLAWALLMVTRVEPGWQVVGYATLLGWSAGAMSSTEGTLLARWFGVDRLGALRGMIMSVAVLSSAIGPVVLSLIEGATGSYVTAAAWTAVVPAAVALAALVVPLPTPAARPAR